MPGGRVRDTTNVTPPAKPDPGPLIAYWPAPWITTAIAVGAQPLASLYVTENVIVVAVVPFPGLAFPAESTGAGCDAPLQLAASTAGAATIAANRHRPAPIEPARANVTVGLLVRSRSSGRPSCARVLRRR